MKTEDQKPKENTTKPSPDQTKIEELEKKNKEYLEGWKRERADSLNYKKDEMERLGALIKYAQEGQILKMLPILDNFSLAARQISAENLSGEQKNIQVIKGFLQIGEQIKEFLKAQGVEEIKTVGEMFNPNFHDAVGEIGPSEASAKEGESGRIVEEVQKGYTISGRVLRPAKVKISK